MNLQLPVIYLDLMAKRSRNKYRHLKKRKANTKAESTEDDDDERGENKFESKLAQERQN